MKQIPLNSGALLELPDHWEDLTREEFLFTVEVLMRLFAGSITPDAARLEMLLHYTSYRPSRKNADPEERENINFNLLKLSGLLDFAFTIEENVIQPQFRFVRNPLPKLRLEGASYRGKIFNITVSAQTDITAREFVDASDLVSAFYTTEREDLKGECLNQLCAILYPAVKNHRENLVSGHPERMRKAGMREKTAVLFWFSGIIRYYMTNSVYKVLFAGGKQMEEEWKIRIGAGETALYLKKEGYGDPETMNLNEYFDAQVKALKDSLSHAIVEGVKIERIEEKTGIPAELIRRLS